MKRTSEENGEIETSNNMIKCLNLLPQCNEENTSRKHSRNNLFQCKTCKRQFQSFQALGGHRASHKKPRWMEDKQNNQGQFLSLANKPKMHKCSICGLEFTGGQALGGHMRRHKLDMDERLSTNNVHVTPQVPMLKTTDSCRRVLCMDLNLTPLENDLNLLFGKNAPKLDIFI